MNRSTLLIAALAAAGAALVLGELRWFRRSPWVERIAPYLPGSNHTRGAAPALSWRSFRDVISPLAATGGNRVSRLLGSGEELGTRLERIHAEIAVSSFRLRQLGSALVGLAGAAVVTAALGPPVPIAAVFLFGAPSLAFLAREQQVARASARWQERIQSELPIMAEQLGMLLGAGYSLSSALNRLARRGTGACAADLSRVCGRLRQGLGEDAALAEWADLAEVDALDRLVAVLALNRQAADLGHLITQESRSMRRDAQRRLIETIERRSQQVWVPVTVAALVPGVLFMVVPFVAAMRLFSTS